MRSALAATVAGVLLAGCTGPSSTSGSPSLTGRPATPAAYGDWPTYHGDAQRSGSQALPLRLPLRPAWSVRLDAAVYASPLVAAGRVVVATEANTVAALDPGTGRQLWSRQLGPPARAGELPCGNIDPLGVTGTPAYDAATHTVFAVAETTGGVHTLWSLDIRTGEPRWHRTLDVAPGRDRLAEQQRGALLVANGRVYVPFGGLFGDCGNYVGYVASVALEGAGPVLHYEVPTPREAGMWAPPGPVQVPGSADVFVASGNGAGVSGTFDGSDSVIRLSPTLAQRDVFAPSTWPADNSADLDLGSSSPVPLPGHQLLVAGKRGTIYLLDADHLGGVGGEITSAEGCAAYGGGAAAGSTVLLPCSDGVRRVDVDAGTLHLGWQLDGIAGSPVIAGSDVLALDIDAGELVVADLADGTIRSRTSVGSVSRFATPALSGRLVLVGTLAGVVALQAS